MKIIKKLPTIIFFGIIAYIGFGGALNSFIVTPFKPEKFEVFEKKGDYQVDRIFLSPQGLLIYSKNNPEYENCFEMALFKISGEKCSNLLGGLWNVDKDGSLFGLRYDSQANNICNLNLELKNKIQNNVQTSSFDDIGDEFQDRIYLYDNAINISAGQFQKIDMSRDEISTLFNYLLNN